MEKMTDSRQELLREFRSAHRLINECQTAIFEVIFTKPSDETVINVNENKFDSTGRIIIASEDATPAVIANPTL
jgi:hypothetical protein